LHRCFINEMKEQNSKLGAAEQNAHDLQSQLATPRKELSELRLPRDQAAEWQRNPNSDLEKLKSSALAQLSDQTRTLVQVEGRAGQLQSELAAVKAESTLIVVVEYQCCTSFPPRSWPVFRRVLCRTLIVVGEYQCCSNANRSFENLANDSLRQSLCCSDSRLRLIAGDRYSEVSRGRNQNSSSIHGGLQDLTNGLTESCPESESLANINGDGISTLRVTFRKSPVDSTALSEPGDLHALDAGFQSQSEWSDANSGARGYLPAELVFDDVKGPVRASCRHNGLRITRVRALFIPASMGWTSRPTRDNGRGSHNLSGRRHGSGCPVQRLDQIPVLPPVHLPTSSAITAPALA
jgi:hypothetical protein